MVTAKRTKNRVFWNDLAAMWTGQLFSQSRQVLAALLITPVAGLAVKLHQLNFTVYHGLILCFQQ